MEKKHFAAAPLATISAIRWTGIKLVFNGGLNTGARQVITLPCGFDIHQTGELCNWSPPDNGTDQCTRSTGTSRAGPKSLWPLSRLQR